MKILITGATGFLGSHLLPELIKKNHEIIIVKRSSSNPWRIGNYLALLKTYDSDTTAIEDIFRENKIEAILHLATDYGKSNNNNSTQMIQCNIELPTRLLKMATIYKSRVFINTHTSASANSEYTFYSASKNAFLEIIDYFALNSDLKCINMQIENMYGEKGDNRNLISDILESIVNKKEIPTSEGKQKRDFIYVKDVVNAYLRALDALESITENLSEFEIGTGKSISLREFVDTVEKIAGCEIKVNWGALPYRKNEIFDSKANSIPAQKLLHWEPLTSLEEGLRKTIHWYKTEWKPVA